MGAFWDLKREVSPELPIKKRDIIDACDQLEVEPDILVTAINAVDDHYRILYAEELKRKRPKT